MRLVTIIIALLILFTTSSGTSEQLKKMNTNIDKIEVFSVQNNEDFVLKIFSCVKSLYIGNPEKYPLEKQIPFDLIVAMAAYESAWGTSRFAKEGNNLFGIRTWDDLIPQMKPRKRPNAKWGVRMYVTYCTCIEDYIQILNNHPAYEEFRIEREKQLDSGKWNHKTLLSNITAWSTNPDYSKIILKAIVDNKLP